MLQQSLPAGLEARYKLVTSSVDIAEHTFSLVHPRSADDLLDEADDNDDRLPYWAEIWPSARMLSQRILREDGRGRSLLELGCGVGLVALAAARAGFSVVATDYYHEALEFARLNADRNGFAQIATRFIDWRELPDDLGVFDVVTGSDVLYERPNAALVAGALAATLAPGGLGLVTDPSRRVAAAFPEVCQQHGLTAEITQRVDMVDGTSRPTVVLYEVRRQT